jgi:Peptidase A4 family
LTSLRHQSRLLIVVSAVVIYAISATCAHAFASTSRVRDTPVFTRANVKALSSLSDASIAVNDSNWAGYVVASDLQNPQSIVTNVSASWIVPTVVPSTTDSYSAIWIGIGGFFDLDTTLIQTGTEQDSIGGQPFYSAWYELLPQVSITIGPVSPGDQIYASIQLVNASTNTWQIYMQDQTSNQTFQSNFNYADSRLSAEWIVERPVIESGRTPRLSALTNIGRVALNSCLATVGTQTGGIKAFPSFQSIMYTTLLNTAGITQLTDVSSLSTDGLSFTVETNPAVVPELSGWNIALMVTGISLLAARKQLNNFGSHYVVVLAVGLHRSIGKHCVVGN